MSAPQSARPPRVSIVIPCYNQAEYLAQAIDSVLAQDYAPIELIVVDDGSTDGSRQVMERYRERCTLIAQANAGQAGAVNRGWAQAQGEILAYLAADDYLLPGAVRRAVECLESHPGAVLCYCDFLVVDPASRTIRKVTTPEYSYRDMALRGVCAPGPGAFLRRGACERAGPWDERLRQVPDFEYWLRLGAEGGFQRIPQVLAAYRAHRRSQSYAPVSPERAAEPLEVIQAYFGGGRAPREFVEAQDEAFSNARILSARLHLRSGRLAEGLRLLWTALRLRPANFLRLHTWWRIASGLSGPLVHGIVWRIRT